MNKQNFDAQAFYEDLERKVRQDEVSWRQVGAATGVSPSTLTRMAQGRTPDAASLAALAAWAGLNPASYVELEVARSQGNTLNEVSMLFRQDSALEPDARKQLESIVEAAYKSLAKHKPEK